MQKDLLEINTTAYILLLKFSEEGTIPSGLLQYGTTLITRVPPLDHMVKASFVDCCM